MKHAWTVFIATSADRPGEGIRAAQVLGEEELTPASPACEIPSANYICTGPGDRLYAVCDEPADDDLTGVLYAFSVGPGARFLTLLARRRTGGTTPCYVALAPDGRSLYVANFRGAGGRPSAGNAAVYAVNGDGVPGEATQIIRHRGRSIHPERQTNPHLHCIVPHPSNRWVFVADLGTDRLVVYRRETPSQLLCIGDMAFEPGAGPRHVAVDPGGRRVYAITEMSNELYACTFDPDDGSLALLGTASSLPDCSKGSAGADLHLSPDGRRAYGTNRGHDSIAAWDVAGPLPRLLGCVPSGGANPRGFALSPDGRLMLVANASSDLLVAFYVDPDTGLPRPTGRSLAVPQPVCVAFA